MNSDNDFGESTYYRYLVLEKSRGFFVQIVELLKAFDRDFVKQIYHRLGEFTEEDLKEDPYLATFVAKEIEILSAEYGMPILWEDGEVYIYVKNSMAEEE